MAESLAQMLVHPRDPVEAYLRMLVAFGEDLADAVTGAAELFRVRPNTAVSS